MKTHYESPVGALPLYPPSQAFLWLPGLPGEQLPYCSYNEQSGAASLEKPGRPWGAAADDTGAPYSPPFAVSQETEICWHKNSSPPSPFHPIPIARTLTDMDLVELADYVIRLMGGAPKDFAEKLKIIHYDFKSYVMGALAVLDLLDCREDFIRPSA
jgi:hypothetical protein